MNLHPFYIHPPHAAALKGGSTSNTAVKGRSDRVLASLRAAPLSPSSLDRSLLLRSLLSMPNMTRTMSETYVARF